MPHFMRNHIALRSIARRVKAAYQLAEEFEVDVDFFVDRTIERAHRRLPGAARCWSFPVLRPGAWRTPASYVVSTRYLSTSSARCTWNFFNRSGLEPVSRQR